MAAPPFASDAGLNELTKRAQALESRGAFAEAVELWAIAALRAPAHLPLQLALAQARLRAGDPAGAISTLDRVVALAPGAPGAWLALAVARSMLGRHEEAVAAAERAVACAPRLAATHLGLGDILRQAGRLDAAAEAYAHAVAIAPEDPDALNKAAVIERLRRRLDEAEAMLRKAIARAPYHPYARVNLGTLLLERGRLAEGEALLDAASRIPGLPPDARSEIADARAMLAERAVLADPLAAGSARDDPVPIVAGLRALRRTGAIDAALVRDLGRLAERIAALPPADATFATGTPRSSAWPALEAHHNVLASRDPEAIARSVTLVANPAQAATDADRDVLHYARAVVRSSAVPPDDRDPEALEAWLRMRHAQLVTHRPALGPGQAKLINNLIGTAAHIPRTAPTQLAATLRAIVTDLAPRVTAGAPRALFLYTALLEMHVFADANGRVMRLALNRWLASAGLFPHLRPSGTDALLLTHARVTGDMRPAFEWIAAGSRYAAALDREWAARDAR